MATKQEEAIVEFWLMSRYGQRYVYDSILETSGIKTPDFYVPQLKMFVEVKTYDEQAWRDKLGQKNRLEATFKPAVTSIPGMDLWIHVGPSQRITTKQYRKLLEEAVQKRIDSMDQSNIRNFSFELALIDGNQWSRNTLRVLCQFTPGNGEVKFMTYPTHSYAGYRTEGFIDFLTLGEHTVKKKSFLRQTNQQLGWQHSRYEIEKRVAVVAAHEFAPLDPDHSQVSQAVLNFCTNERLDNIDEVWLLFGKELVCLFSREFTNH